MPTGPIQPPHGGYRTLRSFQASEAVYDATVAFCERFIDRRSRTVDQMVQAARSGRQNIAEGSRVSGTSKKMEIKLVSVARASLDELLLDYEDFLRQGRLSMWTKDDPRAMRIRQIGRDRSDQSDQTPYASYRALIEKSDAETAANTAICLIHQTNFLLDRQLRALEEQFLREGGFTERLYQVRRSVRSDRSD